MEEQKHDRVTSAYNYFMMRLFGHVPLTPSIHSVDRDTYTKTMHEVQDEYGIRQGDPDFLEWILTMVGRSPRIIEPKELETDGRKTKEADPLGEITPS